MSEATKEQLEKWRKECFDLAIKASIDFHEYENHYFKIAYEKGYLAAKKSDFEEIELLKWQKEEYKKSISEFIGAVRTLKEQLAKAEQLIEEKMVIDDCGFDPSCETKFELENIMRINDCVARQYFAEKEKQEKQDKENKE